MSDAASTASMGAWVDYACLDPECRAPIQFNVMELRASKGQIACAQCHRQYHFEAEFLEKLERLRRLVLTVKEAEDILGDTSIAVTTPAGEVRVPYRLLLTRLNTIITLDVAGRKVDFNFRVEPLNNARFH
jgi:hypothetical protein